MRQRSFLWFVLGGVLLLAGGALGASVYLNGARIDGVINQRFENCTVTIDALGNIYIEAPGTTVKVLQQPASKPSGPTRHYWLVKEENYPGKTQYDIDVYINNVFFKRLRSNEEQQLFEITEKLRLGSNVLHLAATKNIGKERKSFSPQVIMRVIIGEGSVGGNNVMIDRPLVQYVRNAGETTNFNDEFTIQVR